MVVGGGGGGGRGGVGAGGGGGGGPPITGGGPGDGFVGVLNPPLSPHPLATNTATSKAERTINPIVTSLLFIIP